MKKQTTYSPEHIKSIEDDNVRWKAEIKRLRECIEEKNEKIRELSSFQLYCYQHTTFRGKKHE